MPSRFIFLILIMIILSAQIIAQEELIEEEVDLSEEDIESNLDEDREIIVEIEENKSKVLDNSHQILIDELIEEEVNEISDKKKIKNKDNSEIEDFKFNLKDYEFTSGFYITIILGFIVLGMISFLVFSFLKKSKKN